VARGEHDGQTGRSLRAKLHSRYLPHTLQTAAGSRWQLTQMSGMPLRARTAIEAVWPHIPHWRCPRSWRRHRSQIRCPAASRLTTGLTAPQCAQAAVIWRAVHGLHMPPPGVR
jgi:hypothetical protein